MGAGNTNTAGDKNSNYSWQAAVLQILGTINKSVVASGAVGIDYELRQTTYKANKVGTGYSNGDFIIRVDIINALTGAITSTLWFNETAGFSIPAPPQVDLDPYSTPSHIVIDSGIITSITNTVNVALTGGGQTLTSSTVTDSTASPVAAGTTSVGFTTSSTFVGTIDGLARNASTFYGFDAAAGKTLNSIAYTVTAGSMQIDKIT